MNYRRASLVCLTGLALGYLVLFHTTMILVLFLTLPLTFALAALHGYRINKLSGDRLGWVVALKGNSLAVAGSYLVPARLSEVLKPIYFNRRKSLPIVDGVSVVLVERMFDVLALLLLVALAFFFRGAIGDGFSTMQFVGLFIFVAAISGSTLVIKFPKQVEWVIDLFPHIIGEKLLKLFKAFRRGLSAGLKFGQVAATVVAWLSSWLIYWLFLQLDGGVPLGAFDALLVFLAGTLGLAFTVTPGGLGTFEAVVIFTLQSLGYDVYAAAATAIGLRLIGILPSLLIALYTITSEGGEYLTRRFLHRNEWH